MKFSEEYIEICKKLPPHEFEVGDWAHDDQKGIVLVIQIDGLIIVVTDMKGTQGLPKQRGPTTWLPHSPIQWMEMDGLIGGFFLHKWTHNDKWRMWDSIAEEPVSEEDDPLLACAKAWEKTQ